jgi:hypothetical protein
MRNLSSKISSLYADTYMYLMGILLLKRNYRSLKVIEMEFEDLWQSILNERFNRAGINSSKLSLKIEDRHEDKALISSKLYEISQFPIGEIPPPVEKFPGSDGEHSLQIKYKMMDRAIRFYKK